MRSEATAWRKKSGDQFLLRPAARSRNKINNKPGQQKMEMETEVSNNDTTTDILSRLPAKSILRFQSVSKGWHNIINDKSFRKLQFQRAKATISGFFFQDEFAFSDQVKYLPVGNNHATVQHNILDFLPIKIGELVSSNGLLCCYEAERVRFGPVAHENVIYVCNPATKELVRVGWPNGTETFIDFGLAFDPLYAMDDMLNFKLVCVSKENYSDYLFQVYSSKTKEWRKLGLCYFHRDENPMISGDAIFASGVLYWLSNAVLAFDMETEKPHFITLPVRQIHRFEGLCEDCIGESEGRLHYVLISEAGLQVWARDSDRKTKWELKHSVSLSIMEEEHPIFLYNDAKKASSLVTDKLLMPPWIEPLLYKDGIVLVKLRCSFSYETSDLQACTKIYSYNIYTRTMEEFCTSDKLGSDCGFLSAHPYSMSLLLPLESA